MSELPGSTDSASDVNSYDNMLAIIPSWPSVTATSSSDVRPRTCANPVSCDMGRKFHKKQLLNSNTEGVESKGTNTTGTTAMGDDSHRLLTSRTEGPSDRYDLLQRELLSFKMDVFEGDKTGDSLSSLRQDLLKLTLERQALIAENNDLKGKLDSQEKLIGTMQTQLGHLERQTISRRHNAENTRPKVLTGLPKTIASDARREELQIVRDALASLRSNFRGTDPNQHTLDTLEQSISVMMERLNNMECKIKDTNLKVAMGGSILNATNQSEKSTKVIYFTDRAVTPFMSTIPKSLGEITLKDFKDILGRSGNLRFHFKASDPDFGMVKEEVCEDDAKLPECEGKIIAWVEEDNG